MTKKLALATFPVYGLMIGWAITGILGLAGDVNYFSKMVFQIFGNLISLGDMVIFAGFLFGTLIALLKFRTAVTS